MKKNTFYAGVIALVFVVGSFAMFMGGMGGSSKPMSRTAGNSMAGHHGNAPRAAAQPQQGLKVGEPAPDFTLTSIDGETVRLSDYRGKNVVLFFNEGSMCYPACWNQIKAFARDSRFNDGDTATFSIVVDSRKEWEKIVRKVPEMAQAKILFDTDKRVSSAYGALSMSSSMHKGSLPGHTYFLVDKQGLVAYVFDDPSMAVRNNMLADKLASLEAS